MLRDALCFAGLYLPTSDLDVVVLDSNEADLRAALKAVATGLLRKDLARNVQASTSPCMRWNLPWTRLHTEQTGVCRFVQLISCNGCVY